MCRVDQRAGRFDRTGDDVAQKDALRPKLDFAPHEPREVEQVVDEADHVIDLPLEDGDRFFRDFRVDPRGPHDFERVADGGQGITQFVGQRGEEFVLAAISLFGLFVEADIFERDRGPVGEVLGHREVGVAVFPARPGKDEGDRPKSQVMRGKGDADQRLGIETEQEFANLGVSHFGIFEGIGDAGQQAGFPLPQDFADDRRRAKRRGEPFFKPLQHGFLFAVLMGHGRTDHATRRFLPDRRCTSRQTGERGAGRPGRAGFPNRRRWLRGPSR